MVKKQQKSTHKNAYKGRGWVFLGLLILNLIAFSIYFSVFATADNPTEPQIIGDLVTYENNYGKIDVWSHTSGGLIRQTQYLNLTWKQSDTNLDFAFRLAPEDNANWKNKRVYIWKNYSHPNEEVVYGDVVYSDRCNSTEFGLINSTHGWCNDGTYWEAYYEWFNNYGDSVEFFWNETEPIGLTNKYYYDWLDVSSNFELTMYNGDYYYFVKNVNFEQWESKIVRIKYDTPIGTTGKWNMYIKRSQDTIAEALSNGWFVELDPWWNSTFNYQKEITLPAAEATLVDYTVPINVSWDSDMQDDFQDIRFVYGACSGDQDEELNYYISTNQTQNFALVHVTMPNITTGTNKLCMYYSNATPVGEGNNTAATNDNYTRLMLHMDMVNGSTHSTPNPNWDDVSVSQHSATVVSGAIMTDAKPLFGVSTGYFPGSNGRVSFAEHEDWTLGTADFTYDFWILLQSTPGNRAPIISSASCADEESCLITYQKDASNWEMTHSHMSNLFSDSGAGDYNNWQYVAITRIGDTYEWFRDGESKGTWVDANRVINFTGIQIADNTNDGTDLNAYLKDVRISKGIARSSAWINYTYNSVNLTEITFGAETSQDAANPDISITYPSDYTNTSNTNLDVNYTYFDVNPGSCWYSNDSGASNYSLTNCDTNVTGKTWNEGLNTVVVYGNDSSGNENSSQVIFTVDTLAPIINITYPINGSTQTNSTLYVTYTVTESTPDSCWWSNNSGVNNYSLADCTTSVTGQTWVIGTNIVDVYGNDSFGRLGEASVTFELSLDDPIISPGYTDSGGTFSSVINNTFFNNATVNVTANITDTMPGLDNGTLTVYNASGDIINQTTESFGSVNNILWGIPVLFMEGVYTWFFEAYDALSNFKESPIYTLIVDLTAPSITSWDVTYDWQQSNPVYTINASFQEDYLNSTGITFDGINYTVTEINTSFYQYNVTTEVNFVPYEKQFYWWAIDNATNSAISSTYDFTVSCPDDWLVFNNSYCVEKINFTGTAGETYERYLDFVKTGVVTSIIFNISGSGFNDDRTNYTYDNFTDDSIAYTLWDNSSTGQPDCESAGRNSSIIESGGFLSAHSEVCGWDGSGFENAYIETKLLPTYTNIENVTFRHVSNKVITGGSGCGANSDSKIILFGNTIQNGTQNYDAVWTAKRNRTLGSDTFSVYRDGTLNVTINATDSKIKGEVDCYGTVGASTHRGYLESNLYYVDYTYALNDTNVLIELNGTTLLNTTTIDFNSLENQTANFATTTMSYLGACNAVSGNCIVPLSFDIDDKQGLLQVSGIMTSNEGFIENSQTFNTTTTEGATESFQINVTWDSTAYPNIAANLYYNGTAYSATKTTLGNEAIFLASTAIPSVSAQKDVEFYWQVTLINDTSTNFNSTTQNQTIKNLGIDNCGSYTILLLNATLYDEDTQEILAAANKNASVEIDVDIYSKGTRNAVIEFSGNFSQNDNPQVCLENDLGNSEYEMDVQIKYDADDYSTEYYHIQNFTLVNSSLHQDALLYDLLDSRATSFQITFRDGNFLPVEDAIIQVQRKYVEEGVYKSIEIPMTDAKGKATASLITNEIIYTLIVLKNGQVLGTFNDVVAICQNPTIETCIIELNAFSTGISTEDYNSGDDLVYTMTYDRDTRTIQTIYSIPSGASPTMKLNTTLFDNIGSTEACSDEISSPSGTLTCVVPISVGNGTVVATLTRDGNTMGYATVSLKETPQSLYGASLVFIALFLMVTLIGIGTQKNAMILGILLIMGSILLILLNIVDTGISPFVGGGATVLWIIIAIILIMIKGARRQ